MLRVVVSPQSLALFLVLVSLLPGGYSQGQWARPRPLSDVVSNFNRRAFAAANYEAPEALPQTTTLNPYRPPDPQPRQEFASSQQQTQFYPFFNNLPPQPQAPPLYNFNPATSFGGPQPLNNRYEAPAQRPENHYEAPIPASYPSGVAYYQPNNNRGSLNNKRPVLLISSYANGGGGSYDQPQGPFRPPTNFNNNNNNYPPPNPPLAPPQQYENNGVPPTEKPHPTLVPPAQNPYEENPYGESDTPKYPERQAYPSPAPPPAPTPPPQPSYPEGSPPQNPNPYEQPPSPPSPGQPPQIPSQPPPSQPNVPGVPGQPPQQPPGPERPGVPNIPSIPQQPGQPQHPPPPNIPGQPQRPEIPSFPPQIPGQPPQRPETPGFPPQIPGQPPSPEIPSVPNIPGQPPRPEIPGQPPSPQIPSIPGFPTPPPAIPGQPPRTPGFPSQPTLPPNQPQIPGQPPNIPSFPGQPPQIPERPQGPPKAQPPPGHPQIPAQPERPQGKPPPSFPSPPPNVPEIPGQPPQIPSQPNVPGLPPSPGTQPPSPPQQFTPPPPEQPPQTPSPPPQQPQIPSFPTQPPRFPTPPTGFPPQRPGFPSQPPPPTPFRPSPFSTPPLPIPPIPPRFPPLESTTRPSPFIPGRPFVPNGRPSPPPNLPPANTVPPPGFPPQRPNTPPPPYQQPTPPLNTPPTPSPTGPMVPNRIRGKAHVICEESGIDFNIKTIFPFTGQIFAHSKARVPNCVHTFQQAWNINISFSYADCGIKNAGDKESAQTQYHLQIIVMFEQPDGTSSIQSFMAQCIHQKINYNKQAIPKRIEEALEELKLVPAKLEQKAPMPVAEMRIVKEVEHHGEGDGEDIKNVDVGQPLRIEWSLMPESDAYGFHVRDCFVIDAVDGARHQVIDERGCSTDINILGHPHYDTYHDVARVHWHAFKVPDNTVLSIKCNIQICTDIPDSSSGLTSCDAIPTPPFCPDLVTSPTNSILFDVEGNVVKRHVGQQKSFSTHVHADICFGNSTDGYCNSQAFEKARLQHLQKVHQETIDNRICTSRIWLAAMSGLSLWTVVLAVGLNIVFFIHKWMKTGQ